MLLALRYGDYVVSLSKPVNQTLTDALKHGAIGEIRLQVLTLDEEILEVNGPAQVQDLDDIARVSPERPKRVDVAKDCNIGSP